MSPINRIKTCLCLITLGLCVLNSVIAAGPEARPLRYTPIGMDFVITNGTEFFNRPLYGGNTGFRINAGDRPEFAFFFPGRGGSLRLALLPNNGMKAVWLQDAQSIVARYRPGAMIYEIRDQRLGAGALTLTAIPMASSEGFVIQLETSPDAAQVRLLWAYGGVNEERGRRNGDLNGERVPISRFFELKPEYCRSNQFRLRPDGFTLPLKNGTMMAVASGGQQPALADAGKWSSPSALLASSRKTNAMSVVAQELFLSPTSPQFVAFHLVRPGKKPVLDANQLPQVFAAAESHRRGLAGRLGVETPDDYINAAAAAISVAADAVWDKEEGAYMHGANAWRVKLLGWRAAYAGDALGWHDRTRRHFTKFAVRQNTNPIPDRLPPADEKFNLARNESALHSNGDFACEDPHHYDMNLVAVDTFFRHLLWTGDLAFAERMWPVIERHLAWERRLFRRPFGSDSLPLYEAYCCIWASDELIYNGGGVTHATAYNYWHNTMAARVARLLGKDASPYEREARLILQAMQRELWLPDSGWFAEFKDYLGLQAVHPNAAVWTFYHALDSQVASPLEAWQMSRFVDTQIPHIPLTGAGVPPGNYQLATTSWMPYQWSINNVALEESAHTALGLWQAGRADDALPLLKGALLDSMFLGICPGNVGMTTALDKYSGEKYSDFADSVGIASRALVEGLFGLAPDQLAGELRIQPGFPSDWNEARIRHPGLGFLFERSGLKETYVVESKLPKPMALRLQIVALRDRVAGVTVNGQPARWRALDDSVGQPRIEILAAPAATNEIVVKWTGANPVAAGGSQIVPLGGKIQPRFDPAQLVQVSDPQGALTHLTMRADGFGAETVGALGHRTVFAQLAQGGLKWWQPVSLELRPAFELMAPAEQDAESLRLRLRNNTLEAVAGEAEIQFSGRRSRQPLAIGARKESGEIKLAADGLVPGSHQISVRLSSGQLVNGVVVNWKLDPRRAAMKWETVNLTPFFNDRVTQIFRNEYRSPRSPFCSLAIPKQGIGGWCYYNTVFEVDNAGLRAIAATNSGVLPTALGIPFATPGDTQAKNILFTSQWDNYPREATVPLNGRASRVCMLMAGSANAMQCRFDNGEVLVDYTDGTSDHLVLHSPTTWWPIEQDYFIDDFAFDRPEPIPPRVDLKTGMVRVMTAADCSAKNRIIPGGAATVLDLPLNRNKELKSLTLRTFSNELIIGLMAATLGRE
ncbi:MAG: DUF4450 domain-containing protein [Verrucomicrobiota bacterium]